MSIIVRKSKQPPYIHKLKSFIVGVVFFQLSFLLYVKYGSYMPYVFIWVLLFTLVGICCSTIVSNMGADQFHTLLRSSYEAKVKQRIHLFSLTDKLNLSHRFFTFYYVGFTFNFLVYFLGGLFIFSIEEMKPYIVVMAYTLIFIYPATYGVGLVYIYKSKRVYGS